MEILNNCNKYQTPLTKENLDKLLPIELYGEVLRREIENDVKKFTTGIKFIKNLISKDRLYAKDLKRYENPHVKLEKDLVESKTGRIKVNLENPHILEDMDYFRQARLEYERTGKYTQFRPSPNPKSGYLTFWTNEYIRSWEGMIRESDGEWIPGNLYFYWNYGSILKALVDPVTGRTDRIQGVPNVYDGDYWFYHYLERARNQGKHASCLKARGLGYSFKAGNLLARNFILGESYNSQFKTNNIALASDKEYLIKDGVLNKFIDTANFCSEHTPFPNRRDIKDSWQQMHWIMGYVDATTSKVKGTENQVMGVTLNDDPERARGKRSNLIIWEEAGKFKNFLTAWMIARPSVEHNGHAFGVMLAFGTGGTKGAAFEGLKEIFYKPKGYNILEMGNVYDLNTNDKSTCSFFHSRYLNYEGCMDSNGNSDVLKALVLIIAERIEIKYNTSDTGTLPQHIAENPITPQESILQATGTFFPVLELRDYLEECRVNEGAFLATHKVGELKLKETDMQVEFVENYSLKPIRQYTPNKSDVEGAVEIFSMPVISDNTGKAVQGRYIAGIDPVDNDFVFNGSLGSIFIYDTYTDSIVAEYTGRPGLAETFYEICRRLLILYNAIANYESNIKGLFGYFKNKNCLHLLCDTPSHLKDSHSIKSAINSNSSKGTRANESINMEGLRLQLNYLLTSYEDNDGEIEKKVLNLRRIPSLGYLEELEAHNFIGNFDRISAMGMLFLYLKELGNNVRQREVDDFYIEEDDFISKNYDKKMNSNGDTLNKLSIFNNIPV